MFYNFFSKEIVQQYRRFMKLLGFSKFLVAFYSLYFKATRSYFFCDLLQHAVLQGNYSSCDHI
jgi:hypothetical protein